LPYGYNFASKTKRINKNEKSSYRTAGLLLRNPRHGRRHLRWRVDWPCGAEAGRRWDQRFGKLDQLQAVRFTNNFGAEAGYVHFGKATISDSGAAASAEPSSFYAAVTGTVPLSTELSAYGKLGIARTHTKLTASMGGSTESDSTNRTSAMFGVGVSYALSANVSIIGEYENFGKVINEDGGSLKVDHLSVGVRYKF
jgi:opacity protein-like surface antigen